MAKKISIPRGGTILPIGKSPVKDPYVDLLKKIGRSKDALSKQNTYGVKKK